jgi:hypothetical protein
MTLHTYDTVVTWTGNRGTGTSGYRDYARDHDVTADERPTITGSSDPTFRGERSRWNPRAAAGRLAVAMPHVVVPASVRGCRRRGHRLR